VPSIGVEIIEGDGGGAVVRRLGGGVDDGIGLEFLEKIEHALAVADVEFVVGETREVAFEALLIPAGIALGSEKCRPLVVIDSVDLPTELREMNANLRAN
jgi:hypothetical protein